MRFHAVKERASGSRRMSSDRRIKSSPPSGLHLSLSYSLSGLSMYIAQTCAAVCWCRRQPLSASSVMAYPFSVWLLYQFLYLPYATNRATFSWPTLCVFIYIYIYMMVCFALPSLWRRASGGGWIGKYLKWVSRYVIEAFSCSKWDQYRRG
jgi:hypothetical protein